MLSEEEILFKRRWVNTNICSKCKGKCCQRCACDNVPSDFNNDISLIKKALDSEYYTIDFARKSPYSFVTTKAGYLTLDIKEILQADDETLYVRPRNKDRPIVDILHDKEIEGPCIFWSIEKGCALSYENRPMFGRTLIPSSTGSCKNVYYTRNLLIEYWKPYTEELYELAKQYFPKDWELYKRFNFKL